MRDSPAIAGPARGGIHSAAAASTVGYLLATATAELILVGGGLLPGALAYGALLIALIGHYVVARDVPYRALLLTLVLPPLLRLLGLAMPVGGIPVFVWHAMVGMPALLATLLLTRAIRIESILLGLDRRALTPAQAVIGLAGVPLGVLLYILFRPPPLLAELTPLTGFIAVANLIVFVALAEELIFRGAIQGLALRSLGSRPAAVATSSISFAILAMGSLSPLFVLIMLLVGIAFGWTVEVTGSLWGVVGAHAAAVIGLLVVWPALLA